MDKSSLVQALKLAKPALGVSTLIAGVDCFFFDKNKVTAYNGSLAIVSDLGFDFPVTGWINGNTFFKLLNELGNDVSLSVSGHGENRTLLVKSGSTRAQFPALALNGALFNPTASSSRDTILPRSALFLNGIKKCMFS